jgi:hypothetical protein
MKRSQMNRRQFLQTTLTAAAALPVLGSLLRPAIARAEDMLVTEMDDPTAAAMVTALGYVNESVTEGQNCTNCLFYEPGSDGKGKCQLIPVPGALVADGGWCTSFSEKG